MQDKYLLFNLGSAVDIFYEAEHYPERGGFSLAEELGNFAGGPVLNVACVSASRGVSVKVLDWLKEGDSTTDVILNTLQKYGVDTRNVVTDREACNSKVVVIKTGAERSFLVMKSKRRPFDMTDELEKLVTGASCIYSLIYGIREAFGDGDIIRRAREKGTLICFDGSEDFSDPDLVKLLMELGDGLFINKECYAQLAANMEGDPAQTLLANGCTFICLTDGAKGADCITREKAYHADAMKIEVSDTTGAGDSFAGTFLAGLINGYGYQRCLDLACVGGAYACTVFGGQGGACSEEMLLHFAAENKYVISE